MWGFGFDDSDAPSGSASLILFAIVFGPPLWALSLVGEIVRGAPR